MAYPSSYTINSAHIQQDDRAQMVIASTPVAWYLSLFVAFLFILFSVYIATTGSVGLLLALVPLSIGMGLVTASPMSSKLVLDFTTCQVAFTSNYLIRVPRQVQISQPFSDGLQADMRTGGAFSRAKTAVLQLANGTRILMPFSKIVDAENLILRVAGLRRYAMEQNYLSQQRLAGEQWVVSAPGTAELPEQPGEQEPELLPEAQLVEQQQARQRAELRAQLSVQLQSRIQSWVVWLVVIAVIQFASQGFSPWGVLLILVALASLVFKDSALLIVYAVIIGWAGLENLLFSPEVLWKGFALLQGYWAFQLVQDFRRFRKLEAIAAEPGVPASRSRAAMWFPWVSMCLGVLSILVIAVPFIFLLIYGLATGSDPSTDIFELLFFVSVYMALLGFALGIGSWAARFRYRFAAVIGTITSALILLGAMVLSLL